MAPALTRTAQIPDEARDLLGGKNFAHVATVMSDGSPQVTPVWVSADDDTVQINTAIGRVKDRNMRRDERVAISVIGDEDPTSRS